MADLPPTPALSSLRAQIDALDQSLLAMLNQRAMLALQVGEVKKHEGSAVFRPGREAEVIRQLQAHNPGPLPSSSIAPIWREVMSACRGLEAPTRVAYLGPAGTFSEEAALRFFGSTLEAVRCSSIDEVFRSTAAGAVDFGVVPLENSTEGVVTRSLDLLLSTPLALVGETSLRVQHNLLRLVPGVDGIAAVCAHPQALAQCQAWLAAHLPTIERRAVSSNAEGARMASLDGSMASISSERAASTWGLHIVSPAIQDDAHNRTRFGIVADPSRHAVPKRSGDDCTSLVVSVANEPGAVHDMLAPLKAHGVSMSRLESRPARSGQWEYYFYIDLQGHPEDAHVAAALDALRKTCAFMRVLGAYPMAAS
jgi:chorismate mutase / prephenate dehydratase